MIEPKVIHDTVGPKHEASPLWRLECKDYKNARMTRKIIMKLLLICNAIARYSRFQLGRLVRSSIILICGTLFCMVATAAEVGFDILGATPVGSWQLRQDTTVDGRGRTTILEIRSSLLAKEDRNGEPHLWLEMVIDSFKVKKNGSRKKDGEQVVVKTLVPEKLMSGDPANVLTNMRGFGTELIMQSGDQDPMRLSGSGGMFDTMMKAMGTEVNYNFKQLGDESVKVNAGSFETRKIQGNGVTESKVVFKKIRVESDTTVWWSDKVPFGIVKSEGYSITNKKKSQHNSELLEYGLSGAVSLIVKEPKDMPNLGNMFRK